MTLSVSAAVLPSMTAPAQAQGFFQRLFNPQQAQQRQQMQSEEQLIKEAAKVKVSAPRYFTYKPDRLVPVDLRSLSKVTTAAAESTPAPTGDDVATDGVDGTAPIVAPVQLTPFDEAREAMVDIKMTALPEVSKGIVAYYREHPNFVWIEDGKPNDKAKAIVQVLANADVYGLEPGDYEVAPFDASALDDAAKAKAAMTYELALTKAAMTYVLDAERGRVDADRISEYHDLPRHKVDLVAGMSGLAGADKDTIARTLISPQPDKPQFDALVAERAKLKAQDLADDRIVIEPGTFLKAGGTSPEVKNIVAAIRKNGSTKLLDDHADAILSYEGGEEYTPELVSLVKGYQKEHNLSPDGVIGKNTIRALVGETNEAKIAKVTLAMERLRWLPVHLGERRVFINQPAYTATYYGPGQQPLKIRAVVGQKSHQTNFFYDKIRLVEYNPYWGVPYSIIINEMLPKLAKNPSYLDNAGYEVTTPGGRQISSASVDWYAVAKKQASVNVRQYPGPSNALGEVKILFPNKHHIYMHDTPAKSLFQRDARAFSHGCVRLQDPKGMAAAVLGKSKDYVTSRIQEGQNAQEKVQGDIPVYVAYFTAWPDENGDVAYFDDMYDRDRYLLKAMSATEEARS